MLEQIYWRAKYGLDSWRKQTPTQNLLWSKGCSEKVYVTLVVDGTKEKLVEERKFLAAIDWCLQIGTL